MIFEMSHKATKFSGVFMISFRSSLALVGAVVLAALAPQAQAADLVFTMTGNSSTNGTHANSRTFSATDGETTVNVRVTAWSLTATNSSGMVYDSYLGIYSHGLGVTSGDENGSNNTHVVDNQNRFDFLIFQFDQEVSLNSVTTSPFSVGGSTDSDITIGYGNTDVAWNTQPDLNNGTYADLTNFFDGGFTNIAGGSSASTRLVNLDGDTGNVWYVGAAFNGLDQNSSSSSLFDQLFGKKKKGGSTVVPVDGFKVSGLTISTISAVPEPSTWAMMIFGFGMVGGAMRSRRHAGPVAA